MDSEIVRHYVQSYKRLLLLDYDGTLVGFQNVPERAVPTRRLIRVLRQLGDDPRNQVVIISGRNRVFLERHFSGLPVELTAEHGYLVRDKSGAWRTTREQVIDWKPVVRSFMQTATAAVPGSMIEEKASSLVWHYSRAGSKGPAAAAELGKQLRPHLQELGIIAQPGRKILEVRIAGVDKGQIATDWLGRESWDFILAAGDDTTDEALFTALPTTAISVKVRPGPTVAKQQVQNAAAFVTWLETLAAAA
jgi:trehalose 6-phosphate synthase/phosphatase